MRTFIFLLSFNLVSLSFCYSQCSPLVFSNISCNIDNTTNIPSGKINLTILEAVVMDISILIS